jgi:hypothetical protein
MKKFIERCVRAWPTLAGDALLIGVSTPYRKSGLLYRKSRDHFGKDGDVLVFKAPSTTLNPTLDQSIVDNALAAASAEWLAVFRDDIWGWRGKLIEGTVDHGVQSRPPQPGISHHTFRDRSVGTSDSFTADEAHSDNGTAVLDCLVEIEAPFNPDRATAHVAEVLKSYDVYKTTADRHAVQWVVAAFARHGIALTHPERDRSPIYFDCLPLFTTSRVRLIDNKCLARPPGPKTAAGFACFTRHQKKRPPSSHGSLQVWQPQVWQPQVLKRGHKCSAAHFLH